MTYDTVSFAKTVVIYQSTQCESQNTVIIIIRSSWGCSNYILLGRRFVVCLYIARMCCHHFLDNRIMSGQMIRLFR